MKDSNATYQLYTNGSIAAIDATAVTGVNLTVDTQGDGMSFPEFVGDGHIDTITLAAGNTVSVKDRGDLGSITGPAAASNLQTKANDLVFADLTGSITGLDHISSLTASGWLGKSEMQQVQVAKGIDSLTAYGVGALVQSDQSYAGNDTPMKLTVGAGGISGEIDAGNLDQTTIQGNSNVLKAQSLVGDLTALGALGVLALLGQGQQAMPAPPPSLNLGDMGLLILQGPNPVQIQQISANSIGMLVATNSLEVVQSIGCRLTLGNVIVGGDFKLGTGGGQGDLSGLVGIRNINVAGTLEAMNGGHIFSPVVIGPIRTGKDLLANVVSGGNTGAITVGGNFIGAVSASRTTGIVGPINVVGRFQKGPAQVRLVSGAVITSVIAKLGILQTHGGSIVATNSIGTIQCTNGSIDLTSIEAQNGSINSNFAEGSLDAPVTDTNGIIWSVTAGVIRKNISSITRGLGVAGGAARPAGSIYAIQANNILANVTIEATWFIGSITVNAKKGQDQKFTVRAQDGIAINPLFFMRSLATIVGAFGFATGLPPVSITVTGAQFLGTVTFSPFPRPAPGDVMVYGPTDPLLAVSSNGKITTWKVAGPAGLTSSIRTKLVWKKFDGIQPTVPPSFAFDAPGPNDPSSFLNRMFMVIKQ